MPATTAARLVTLISINIFIVLLWHHAHFVVTSPTPLSLRQHLNHYSPSTFTSAASIRDFILPPIAPPPPPIQALPDPAAPSLATQSCEVCIVTPDDPLCRYGLDSINLSRAHEGSGYRMRRFLQKAMRGESVGIGIIGASVTAGHGLRGESSWQQVFFNDFVKIFPNAQMHSGAVPGMNTDFFGRCWGSVLPDNLDLYILELDINSDWSDGWAPDDRLFRSLLSLPSAPAVVRVSAVAVSFGDLMRGTAVSLVVSHFFDIPIISVRNAVLHTMIDEPKSLDAFFSKDGEGNPDYRHQAPILHQFQGDLLSLYVRKEMCEAKRRALLPATAAIAGPWPQESTLAKIPRLRVDKAYSVSYQAKIPIRSCQFVNARFAPLLPRYPPQTPESPPNTNETSTEWKLITWHDKSAYSSSIPGSIVSFDFKGTNIGVFSYQTNGIGNDGAKNDEDPGRAICWIEPEVESKKMSANGVEVVVQKSMLGVNEVTIDGYTASVFNNVIFTMVGEGLSEGSHILSCRISQQTSTKGYNFRISGISGR